MRTSSCSDHSLTAPNPAPCRKLAGRVKAESSQLYPDLLERKHELSHPGYPSLPPAQLFERSPVHPPDVSFATRTSPTTLTATLICFPQSPPNSAPTGKRAPPAVHSSPSAPLLQELRFRIQLRFLPVPSPAGHTLACTHAHSHSRFIAQGTPPSAAAAPPWGGREGR